MLAILACALLAIGALGTACGGDGADDGVDTPTPEPTAAETTDVIFEPGDDTVRGSGMRLVETESGALRVTDSIYMTPGFGNTIMVVTDEGNVIIDTSLVTNAQRHYDMLRTVDDSPIEYVILTHVHPDHVGGVSVWKEEGTKVIAQRNHVEFRHYQHRLAGLFATRNSAMFPWLTGGQLAPPAARDAAVENYGATVLADVLFDDAYQFQLGGLTFQLFHTPGETYDHLSVWIPELKVALTGDNYYGSFPNIYTLRGTKPRWALDYVESLDTVIGWKPEILVPSHENPVYGNVEIKKALTDYRDAILYVHDETVRGMNAGEDVHTLMREIQLPPELARGDYYGNLPWTVRGIYEGYMGWFDGDPATMYSTPPSAAYPELVAMAGGAEAVAKRAADLIAEGDVHEGLHMADMALEAHPENLTALQARVDGFSVLQEQTENINERSWLDFGIRTASDRIDELTR
jgi:alkyl sulfatase BDS1-like metallo-beta-lactamase superfamily hydrolase